MANKLSSRKRVRQNERRRLHNRSIRSGMRTAVRKVNDAIREHDTEALDTALPAAQSRLGKAAKRKVIKKNNLARKQSRLMKAAHKARIAAGEHAEAPAEDE